MASIDDRRRYFIIGSVMIEVVTPLLRYKLETSYQQQFGTFRDFLNSQPVKHTLFHLRHRNAWCCTDKQRCTNGKLPLYHSQWDLLYTETPGQTAHYCHCKFTAKVVQVDDLDITLVSLILLNCCTVSPADAHAIKKLRQFKNELFSHNTTGGIQQAEYDAHWVDISPFVLQLDPSKQDDLIRLQNRPLDDLLCTKYFTVLLDIHEILDKLGISVQQIHVLLQSNNAMMRRNTVLLERLTEENNAMMNRNHSMLDRNTTLTEESHGFLQQILAHLSVTNTLNPDHHRLLSLGNHLNRKSTFGKEIFTIEKTLVASTYVTDALLLDDGRIVTSECMENTITISNMHDIHRDIIQVQCYPFRLTSINSSTVAVSYLYSACIDIYDINSRIRLKSILLTKRVLDITTMNNKLIVGVLSGFLIIDYDTGVVMETINIGDNHPDHVHAFNDKIYFSKWNDKALYCYNINNGIMTQIKLPCTPWCMTSLSDGSLYVISYVKGENKEDCSTLLHVSADFKQYKPVLKPDLKLNFSFDFLVNIDYNPSLRKLIVNDRKTYYVFNEK